MSADGRRRGGGFPPALKRFGQHFLTDGRILERIADALELTGRETVVEIGPGRGALTSLLLERAGRVVAIEIDRALAELLRQRWAGEPRFALVERDVLQVPLHDAAGGDFVLAGNVPYNITTPILFHAMEQPRPARAVYLVQKEVAERVVADPGSKAYGALTVNVQVLADAELLFRVPPGAFSPPPKVDSAVLRIVPRAEALVSEAEEEPFSSFVLGVFALRRKQLRRVVRTVARLDAEGGDAVVQRAGLDPEARPEVLSPAEFVRLFRAMKAGTGDGGPGAGGDT